jgi:hypothetical protein
MSAINRRHFLQVAGSTLAALGVSQLDLQHNTLQYGKVLAQDTRRKRALLVGINEYPGSSKRDLTTRGVWYRLRGAVNDVMLQRELLIHRFGFHPDEIRVLTDQQATRENILAIFQTWLIDWVKSDSDVVVFHYSGHGSTVIDPYKVEEKDGLSGTIAPFGSQLPEGFAQGNGGKVDDITGGSIFLLREALGRKTKNVTFILDSCYSGGGVRGDVVVRSRDGQAELQESGFTSKLEMSQVEREFQQRWLKDLQLSEPEWIKRRKQKQALGVAIFAARRNQLAVDATFAPNLHAGVFTYALTRQLWQQTSDRSVGTVIALASTKTQQFLKSENKQNPDFDIDQRSRDDQQFMYFTPVLKAPAEAIITKVDGKVVQLLLPGVEPQSLEAMDKGAVFTLINDKGDPQGTVEIQSRDRLAATGVLKANAGFAPSVGALLQEQARMIPTNLQLRIGLDPSLGKELESAKQALRSLPRIEAIPLSDGQDVHYILGRMLPRYRQEIEAQIQRSQELSTAQKQAAIAELPSVDQIGLFSVSLDPIPGSFRLASGKVEDAIRQLQTKLKVLLAGRLINLMLNTTSSRLNVGAQMKLANSTTLLTQLFTMRGAQNASPDKVQTINLNDTLLPKVEIKKNVEILVENREAHDLHIGVLIFSPDGDIDVMFPKTDAPDAALVKAKSPQKIDDFNFNKPLGIGELLIVASTSPIQKALKPLQSLAQERLNPNRSEDRSAEKTETAIASLLEDFDSGTRSGVNQSSDVYKIDTKQIAALSLAFEIVDAIQPST